MKQATRREVLRGAGSLAVIGGSGAVAIREYMAPTVSAQVDVQDTTLSGESPNGEVSEVRIEASGSVEWSNLPDSAQTVQIEMDIEQPGGEYTRLYTDFVEKDRGSGEIDEPFEFSTPPRAVIENTAWSAEDFSATEDGQTNITQLPLRFSAVVFAGGGGPAEDREIVRDSSEQTVTVQVTNSEGNGSDNPDPSVGADVELGGYVEMQADG